MKLLAQNAMLVAAFTLLACGESTTGSENVTLAAPDHTSELLSLRSAAAVAEHISSHATGTVVWVNGPGMKGKIERTDDGSGTVYEYNAQAGHTIDGYRPQEGDKVEFVVGPGRVAREVRKANTAADCRRDCELAYLQKLAECETTYDVGVCGFNVACQNEMTNALNNCKSDAVDAFVSCLNSCR